MGTKRNARDPERDHRVLDLLSAGRTTHDVARELGVTYNVVMQTLGYLRLVYRCATNYELMARFGRGGIEITDATLDAAMRAYDGPGYEGESWADRGCLRSAIEAAVAGQNGAGKLPQAQLFLASIASAQAQGTQEQAEWMIAQAREGLRRCGGHDFDAE